MEGNVKDSKGTAHAGQLIPFLLDPQTSKEDFINLIY
jgi:hypothetical protein